jgi:hypothetical protein
MIKLSANTLLQKMVLYFPLSCLLHLLVFLQTIKFLDLYKTPKFGLEQAGILNCFVWGVAFAKKNSKQWKKGTFNFGVDKFFLSASHVSKWGREGPLAVLHIFKQRGWSCSYWMLHGEGGGPKTGKIAFRKLWLAPKVRTIS